MAYFCINLCFKESNYCGRRKSFNASAACTLGFYKCASDPNASILESTYSKALTNCDELLDFNKISEVSETRNLIADKRGSALACDVYFLVVTLYIFKNEIEYMRSKLTIHCRKKFGIPKYEADILIYNKFFHMPFWTEIRRQVFSKLQICSISYAP